MSIRIQGLTKRFAGQTVIDRLDLEIAGSGVTGISGPSGCGKTTLLRLLAGLERPDAGHIEGLDGRSVSMVFQEDRLLPWLTALENVALVTASQAEAQNWLEKVQLVDFAGYYPAAMSGGMKRRLALARALARPAGLLLLDEPFTGMDDELKGRLFDLIRSDAAQRPVLLVTHDQADIRQLAQQVFLVDGPPLRLILKQ